MPPDRHAAGAPADPSAIIASPLSLLETIPWIGAVLVFFVAPEYLAFATTVVVMVLFALSLDLLMGYCGVITLGHAMFFGIGAYGAGLLAKGGWTEPISALIAASIIASAVAACAGLVLSQLRGIAMIMTTMAFGLIAYEVAKSATWITGGDDGLQGFSFAPVFGVFRWSVYGHTAYLYALAWVFLLFCATRLIVASPFGLALQGLRENYGRMQLLGAPVRGHLIRAFAMSGFLAGAAGALSAQTTSFVDLNVLSVDLSASVLVMLVLGGLGRLYGAIAGVVFYMIVHNIAAKIDPYNWMFVVGAMLVVVVLFSPGGLLGLLESARNALARRTT
jgi:branched-chain amino acid transport system permease protein